MKKRAVIIVQYENEKELNQYVAANGNAYVEVSTVYEDLGAADIEHLEYFIQEQIVPVEEEVEEE